MTKDATVSILLVDDRSEDLLALTSVLSAPNRRLVTVRSGDEALKCLLNDQDFAAIVTDVVMPGMDGFELASMIRSRRKTAQIPILFLTGVGDDTRFVYKAYDVGAVDILVKPVDPDVVRAKIRVFVDIFEKDRRIKQQARALVAAERKDRKIALARLRLENARRYRNLVDAMSHMVWMSDRAGRITHVNRRWVEYSGSELDATKSWLDIVHPDDLPATAEAWKRSIESGEPFEADCRLRRADGAYRWHLCRATPDTHESSLRSGWLGTHTDLDEVVRARVQAEDARRRLVFLAEVSAVLARSLDVVRELRELARRSVAAIADVCIVNVSDDEAQGPLARMAVCGPRAAAQSWDRVIDQLPTTASEPLLLTEMNGEGVQRLTRTEADAESLRALQVSGAIMVPVVSRDKTFGVLTLLALRGGRTYDSDDLAMALEIGRRAGEAVDNALLYRAAERAIQTRDDFLSVASHELRTPLSALMLQLGSLERYMTGDPRATIPSGKSPAKKFAAAVRNTNRMASLVEKLLDVSHLTEKRVRLELEDCELCQIVSDVAERFSEEARAAGCQLTVSAAVESHGRWDRLRIEQVLTNLLSNALKYGAGSPVEVSLTSDPAMVRILVRDHGIGIARSDQPRIFNRFERAASVRHYGGLGLGLYIVKQIVEAHRGTVRLESEAGQGTTFEVELPRMPGTG